MKNALCIVLILFFNISVFSQSIKQKDKYGQPIAYIDGGLAPNYPY
jgi:hypothetical protein